jgi:hypothetical protein
MFFVISKTKGLQTLDTPVYKTSYIHTSFTIMSGGFAVESFSFRDKGVLFTKCPNVFLCEGMAQEPRTLCGRCHVFGGRIFFSSTAEEDIECYVCAESGQECIKYTCSKLHGVCIPCFKDVMSNVKTFNALRVCSICKLKAPKSQPTNPNEPEVKLGQPDGILIRDGTRMPTRDEIRLGWLPGVPVPDDPMMWDLDDAKLAEMLKRWN